MEKQLEYMAALGRFVTGLAKGSPRYVTKVAIERRTRDLVRLADEVAIEALAEFT